MTAVGSLTAGSGGWWTGIVPISVVPVLIVLWASMFGFGLFIVGLRIQWFAVR